MKQFILLAMLFSFALGSTAQQNQKPTNTMPEGGFWVVESNIKTPKHSVIHFYNSQGQCISKETVSGKRVNVKRKRVARQLNAVLQQSLLAWKEGEAVKENAYMLAAKLR